MHIKKCAIRKDTRRTAVEKRKKKWIACQIEEDFLGDRKKEFKKERKMASHSDRSSSKKTDRDQKKQQLQDAIASDSEGILGMISSIQSQGIIVQAEGKSWVCELRGILKKQKWDSKNFVTVGDRVLFEPIQDNYGTIYHVEPRKSILSRADNLSRRKEQLIAANIDQVLITVSVVSPELKPALVDRYIIAARKGNMTPVIIVNKVDLLKENTPEMEQYNAFMDAYHRLGLEIIPVSTVNDLGIDRLKEIMKDKSSVFSGQSGVGKSSLINKITGSDLRIGETVVKTNKGAHTTTNPTLLPLEQGGWCIDTPGIKSFGIWDLDPNEMESYFSDIHEIGLDCRYPNCIHVNEPDCAVQKALESGKLSPIRFESYLALLSSIQAEHMRR